jgi:hypothetical protein
MAIVKANYVKRGATARTLARATIRYNQDRPGKKGAKLTRELFGTDGSLTREQVYKMIDEAQQGAYFYRLVISPDPVTEDSRRDLDLRDLTLQTMVRLEERLHANILFAAVVHDDHRPHRHVHVLALLDRKLNREDFQALRQSATSLSLMQRRMRDLGAERKLTPRLTPGLTPRLTPKYVSKRPEHAPRFYAPAVRDKREFLVPPKRGVPCPRACSWYGQTMEHLYGRLHKCPPCGIIVRKNGEDLEIKQPSLGLTNSL